METLHHTVIYFGINGEEKVIITGIRGKKIKLNIDLEKIRAKFFVYPNYPKCNNSKNKFIQTI